LSKKQVRESLQAFEAPVDALSTELQVDPLEVRPPGAETPAQPGEDSGEVSPPPSGEEAATTETQALDANTPLAELGSLESDSETPSLSDLPSLEDSSTAVLPDSLEQVNPSDIVQPAEVPTDLAPEHGEATSAEAATPLQVGTTPQEGPMDVVMPESLSPAVPTVGSDVNPIETIVPPVGFEPDKGTAITIRSYAVEDEPAYVRQSKDNDSEAQSDLRETERNTGRSRPWWESRTISQLESKLAETSPVTANTRAIADYLATNLADNPSLKPGGTQFFKANSNVFMHSVIDPFGIFYGRGGTGNPSTARPAATTAPATSTAPTLAPAINGRPNVVTVPNPIPNTLGNPATAAAGALAMATGDKSAATSNPSASQADAASASPGSPEPNGNKPDCPPGMICDEKGNVVGENIALGPDSDDASYLDNFAEIQQTTSSSWWNG
jgi:hypothetical protein